MKVLITGANGQMGNEFRNMESSNPGIRFIFTDVEEMDISSHESVQQFLHAERPDVVVNCAAYTAVDKAESEPEKAMRINGTAAEILAQVTNEINAVLIHISTDYVFDGLAWRPYTEEDPVNPVSVYARSKYAGEVAVTTTSRRAVIIRTAWLYSSYGANFVKTILKYGRERDSLNVIFDQTGTPTYARDLCRGILAIIPHLTDHQGVEVFHYSNEGVTSWYDFAKTILEFSGTTCRVNPIETSEYPVAAVRPCYSVLNKARIRSRFHLEIPYWRDSLRDCIQQILQPE